MLIVLPAAPSFHPNSWVFYLFLLNVFLFCIHKCESNATNQSVFNVNGRGSTVKQSARWQHLSWLKASAFFSLQKNLVSCMKRNNLHLGLVTHSSGWWSPIVLPVSLSPAAAWSHPRNPLSSSPPPLSPSPPLSAASASLGVPVGGAGCRRRSLWLSGRH